MDKYYLGKCTINGEPRTTAHTIANFNGTLEQAAEIIAGANPGLEDLEVTENGDTVRGMIELPKPPVTDRDFAAAMMRPPRTVKVGPPKHGLPNAPFNVVAGGVPKEVVSAEEAARLTGQKK